MKQARNIGQNEYNEHFATLTSFEKLVIIALYDIRGSIDGIGRGPLVAEMIDGIFEYKTISDMLLEIRDALKKENNV